jgi:hypothetical protein
MATPFEQSGQQHVKPVRYAPIFTNRYFTGWWTQRNLLRDAATPFLYEKFYSGSRYDSLVTGQNVELTTKLTLARRPGSSVYNSQVFGPIIQFVSFKFLVSGVENIQVIVQSGEQVINATGPNTKIVLNVTNGFPIGFVTAFNPELGPVLLWSPGPAGGVQYDGTNQYGWGIPTPATNNQVSFTVVAGDLSPTVGYQYVAEYKNSATGDYSNAGPASVSTGAQTSKKFILTGTVQLPPNVADTISIFRTLDGGSTFFWLADVPNPYPGSFSWTYTDDNPDSALNIFQQAAVAEENTILTLDTKSNCSAFHLGLVWVGFDNTVIYSRPNSAVLGNGFSGFPPLNYFTFPSAVTALVPTAVGLLVFTTSDIYIIQGNTTDPTASTGTLVFSTPLLIGYGTRSAQAVCVDGGLVYFISNDNEILTLDSGAGTSEVGFPIGDQIQTTVSSATGYATFLRSGSSDKALYITTPFGGGTTYRLSPTSAPETGLNWSLPIKWASGCSAAQAIETVAGTHQLLLGPALTGPILYRDSTVRADNGVAYDAYFVIGNIVLAQPGQLAEISFVAADLSIGGSTPTVSVLFDELAPSVQVPFTALPLSIPDPPELPASVSILGLRWYISQAQLPAWCRHMQLKVDWGASATFDEIYSNTLFGAVWNLR